MSLPTSVEKPGSEKYSIAKVFGEGLRDEMNKHDDFYFFSPDETTSNRLSGVYEASSRAWVRAIEPWDVSLAKDGRVIEMLSENVLFATMAGHILSGGRGCMTSYESFLPIVSSQLDQHLKFLKQAKEASWRPRYQALNILSTSCWQRQDHNGYTHQNPALISNLLAKPSNEVNCLFPVDDVAAAAAWEFMTRTKDVVNLTTFNKVELPRWIDINHARFQLTNGGASIFQFASDDNPEIIVCGIGDIPTVEALEGIKIAKEEVPDLRVRFVGVAALSYGAIGTTENKLKPNDFNDYFTPDKPIVVSFHGYPETAFGIFSHYASPYRLDIHGYQDQGSTTSPMDELARNGCSRYDIAASILERSGHYGFMHKFQDIIVENAHYASQFGIDQD
ncbi:hypothetical protein J6X15_03550 [Candidatus Saccharibacteria bacterium]|nr:hypothetical protein [Candidatus Saccharibacteria bacterium]MBP5656632.1 hypothetical protein [Candidatus Saccharibacteria bacterium]